MSRDVGHSSTMRLTRRAISPALKKFGCAVAKQIENLCTKFTSTLGVVLALMVAGLIGRELLGRQEALSLLLEIAKHLFH